MPTAPTSNFEKISPTAFLVTHARQYSDIPYTKDLAELVDAQTVADRFIPEGQERPIHTPILIEARYKTINRVLAQFQIRQIIELASGLLPRGAIATQNPDITFVESDLPAIVALKQKLVKQLIGDRSNLHFETIDATHQPSQFPIGANYLRDDEPVAILCEGLLVYFNFEEKARVFANVREVLQRYRGVWITSDLIAKERRKQLQQNIPAMQQMSQSISSNTGRSLDDNSFDTIEQAKQFAAEQGFRVEEHSFLEVFDELACIKNLGIDREFAKKVLASGAAFALTLDAG